MKFFKWVMMIFGMYIASSLIATAQIGWWGSQDSVNIFTRSRGGVMIGAVSPFAKLTVGGDAHLYNLALVSDMSNLSKNYLKIGVLGQSMEKYQGHILFDLYHSNAQSKYAGFNFRVNGNSMMFINGDGNIGLGTELPEGKLHIKNGPDWNGLKNGILLNQSTAIRFETGSNQFGLVGNNDELNFVLSNPNKGAFDKPFFKILTVQPKKIIIDGDLQVNGRIINSNGYTGGVVDQGGSTNDVPVGNGKSGGVILNAAIPGDPVTGTDSWIAGENNSIYYNLGHVGIGTTNPYLVSGGSAKMFEIAGISNPGLALRNTGAGGRQYFLYSNAALGSFRIYDASGSTDRLVIDSAGNVGIGTTMPLSKLYVEGMNSNPLITANAKDSFGSIGLQSNGQNKLLLGYNWGAGNFGSQTAAGDVSIFANTNLHVAVGTSGNHPSRMTFATSGKIGVGKTNPVYNFDVAGILNADSILVKGVSISGSGNQWVKADTNLYYNSGNVGIGTTNPDTKLTILGADHVGINIHTTTGSKNAFIGLYDSIGYKGGLYWDGGSQLLKMHTVLNKPIVIDPGAGNIGIGTNNPSTKLAIVGNEFTNTISQDGGYVYTELAQDDWSGSFGLMFNAYKTNPGVNGYLFTPGNTKYKRSGGTYSQAAAAVGGWLNGGTGAIELYSANTGTADADIIWTTTASFSKVSAYVSPRGTSSDFYMNNSGLIGIGTTNPTELLTVNGNIRTKKVIVTQQNWSDFVFEKDYKLRPLAEVENHIQQHKHLPDIPSEKEIKESGLDVGDVQAKLLQKIEELTLYVIQQQKEIEALKKALPIKNEQ